MSPIGLSSNSTLEQAVVSALQSAGVATNASSGTGTVSSGQSDSSQLSSFAQIVSTLQQLQESNPTQYAKVTAQVAQNLDSASQTAQAQGNSTEANQLTQLANNFTTASQTGQLPNLQNLAQAVSGSSGHHHHHHHGGGGSSSTAQTSSSDSTSTSTSTSDSTTSSSDSTNGNSISPLSQYQLTPGDSPSNAATIILQTLANAQTPTNLGASS